MKHYRPFCYITATFLLVDTGLSTSPALAEAERATLTWQQSDDKDALTDKVTRQVKSAVKFADENSVEAYAKCGATANGTGYPGLAFVIAAFQGGNLQPTPFSWQDNELALPVLVNQRHHAALRLTTNISNANAVTVGFYHPPGAKRLIESEKLPPVMLLGDIAKIKHAAEWDALTAYAGGTLSELMQATSIRVQLPLADGSKNVIEINPQDPVLKSFAEECNAHFDGNGRYAPEIKASFAPSKAETFGKQFVQAELTPIRTPNLYATVEKGDTLWKPLGNGKYEAVTNLSQGMRVMISDKGTFDGGTTVSCWIVTPDGKEGLFPPHELAGTDLECELKKIPQ